MLLGGAASPLDPGEGAADDDAGPAALGVPSPALGAGAASTAGATLVAGAGAGATLVAGAGAGATLGAGVGATLSAGLPTVTVALGAAIAMGVGALNDAGILILCTLGGLIFAALCEA